MPPEVAPEVQTPPIAGITGDDWDGLTPVPPILGRTLLRAGLQPSEGFACAVSGGGDSMALALLAMEWSSATHHPVVLMVVDHDLREDSQMEAQQVCRWLTRAGVEGVQVELLSCTWPRGKPSVGQLQQAAREARYALLEQMCHKLNIRYLLTGHHAGDQAELFLLRLARCSGVVGLAGMAPAAVSPRSEGITVIRPLLAFSKRALLQICKSRKQAWIEDPSNRLPVFARNRIRSVLEDASCGVLVQDVLRIQRACSQARADLESAAAQLRQRSVQEHQGGGPLELAVNPLLREPRAVVVRHMLASLLKVVSGRQYGPRSRGIAMLLKNLQAYRQGFRGATTAGGCTIAHKPGSKGSLVLFVPLIPKSLGNPIRTKSAWSCVQRGMGLGSS